MNVRRLPSIVVHLLHVRQSLPPHLTLFPGVNRYPIEDTDSRRVLRI
jgi:hypothetical protein